MSLVHVPAERRLQMFLTGVLTVVIFPLGTLATLRVPRGQPWPHALQRGQIVPVGPVGPGCARLILAATGIGLAHTIAPIGTAVTMWHICNHTHASARTR